MSSTVRKSIYMTGGSLLNVVVGVGFQLILASRLGVSDIGDLYFLSSMVPTLVATILIGSSPSVLVPVIVANGDGRVSALTFAKPTLGLVSIVIGMLVVQPYLIEIAFGESQNSGLASISAICVLACPFAWITAICQSISIAREKFLIVGISGAINGIALVSATAFFFSYGFSGERLAMCFVAGYVLQAVIQSIAVRNFVSLSGVSNPAELNEITRRLSKNLAIMFASALLYKSQPIVERTLSALFEGGPSVISYAEKITQAALLASTLGLALISLPQISKFVSEGRLDEGRAVATRVVTYVAAFAAPITAVGVIHAEAIVRVIYLRGEFNETAVGSVSTVVRIALIGVAFSALSGPMVNYLYARGMYKNTASISVAATAVGIVVSLLCRSEFGLPGVVAGGVFTLVLNFFAFFALIYHEDWRSGLLMQAQVVAIFSVTVIAATLTSRVILNGSGTMVHEVAAVCTTLVAAGTASVGIAWTLKGTHEHIVSNTRG